jgi:hypothetical protein
MFFPSNKNSAKFLSSFKKYQAGAVHNPSAVATNEAGRAMK